MQAKYTERVEPLKYVGILVLAFICTCLSGNYIFLIFESFLNLLTTEQQVGSSTNYIDSLMADILSTEDGEEITFGQYMICASYFILSSIYLLICAIKGNDTYGYRFACFTFYPVT